MDYEHDRKVRREFVNCCLPRRELKWPDALDVVGFATESARNAHGSEDAAYLDARDWSAAAQAEAARLQRDLEILVKPNMLETHVAEYPTQEWETARGL